MIEKLRLCYNKTLKLCSEHGHEAHKKYLYRWASKVMNNSIEIRYIGKSGKIANHVIELVDSRSVPPHTISNIDKMYKFEADLYFSLEELSSKYCPFCRDLAEKARTALHEHAAKFPRITHKFIDSLQYPDDLKCKGDYISSDHHSGYVTISYYAKGIFYEIGIRSRGDFWGCCTHGDHDWAYDKVLNDALWKKTLQYCAGLIQKNFGGFAGKSRVFADILIA